VLPLSVASLLLCTGVLLLYAARVRRFGRARHERLGAAPGSALLPGWAVEAFYWALQAPGRLLARLGVDPDLVTLLALLCSLGSLPLLAVGRLAEGAVCVGVGGCLDALDGMVARLRGRASPGGAVLDAVLDRLSDSAPFAGLVVLYRGSVAAMLVPLAALVASSLVSYARARADAYGLRLPDGIMRRHERVAYLVLTLLLAPLAPPLSIAPDVPYPVALAGVAFIAAAGFAGAFLLVARTRAALARPAALPAPAPTAVSPTPDAPLERAAP
jgi:CDP-diacylglycerol---glycerol-3-phosphate 3-phosphatidyltransferase